MKVDLRLNHSQIPTRKPALAGVRTATTSPPRKQQEQSKPTYFSWKRVLTISTLGFVLTTIIAYFIGVPGAQYLIDFVTNPTFSVTKTAYPTYRLTYDQTVPETVKESLNKSIEGIEINGVKRFSETGNNVVTILYTTKKEDRDLILSTDYIVFVGHAYWVRDTLSTTAITTDGLYVPEGTSPLYNPLLSAHFGKDIPLRSSKNLAETLQQQEATPGIILFSQLNGNYKPLALEGKQFFDSPSETSIPLYLVARANSELPKQILYTKTVETMSQPVDFSQILSVRMTGVTAIARALAMKTNASGDGAYAAWKIGEFLAKADLTHVSNEVSFKDGCVPTGGVSFCSAFSYLEALKKSGVDIVELTGNHNNDVGASWNASTINTYVAQGWSYFGGGLNSTDAEKILYKEVKGTKIAFLGYNYYDTIYGTGAIASSGRAGANSWSLQKAKNDIATAKAAGAAFVIVDLQYQECWAYTDDGSTVKSCYAPIASPNQKADFRSVIDVGADMVIGTQAHQPQTYELYNGKLIFYGLGNLFFDQTQQLGTRQGLVLTHYYYQGKFLGTAITTTIYDNDLLTYVTTGEQRTSLLNSLKNAR